MTPVFTVAISIMFLQKSYSKMIYLSLLPVSLQTEKKKEEKVP
jgi:hypothetical protein